MSGFFLRDLFVICFVSHKIVFGGWVAWSYIFFLISTLFFLVVLSSSNDPNERSFAPSSDKMGQNPGALN